MASTTATAHQQRFLADARDVPVTGLNIAGPWAALTKDEKLYAHWMGKAAWGGGRIVMTQTTFHAERLFDLVMAMFSSSADERKLADLSGMKQRSQLGDDEWADVLSYCAQVLSNLANIKSFGATKFIPRASEATFEAVVKTAERKDVALPLWNELKEEIYSLEPEAKLTIGKPSDGHLSSYYPSEIVLSDAEVDEVQALADQAGVSTLNTRLSKESNSLLTLHLASSDDKELPPSYPAALVSSSLGFTCKIVPGDYKPHLERVNKALKEAQKYAGDKNRSAMLSDYVECFKTGDIEKHKDGSRKWVKDQGPVIETYLGQIEDYVDPYGSRAEWEGFVACVNKEQSAKFTKLVDAAEELIKCLPWGKDFEVPTFKRPDFTALEILTFCTSGIPAGINIPNYADVREQDGFKNVSLSNILSAKAPNEKTTFVAPEEVEAFDRWSDKAFEVQVANHELLGHGTGRQLQENADGTFNFDRSLINPLTGKPIDKWYKPGETYSAKVGPVSSSMEECRAEAVALFLAFNADILKIFDLEGQDAEDLAYYTYLLMVRAGVRALEWYDPKTKKHGQAHMEARLGITKWLIEHGIASVEEIKNESGELVDAYARVDRKACLEKGQDVMGKLLLEIQVRKSTGDGPGATAFYKQLTEPSANWVDNLRPLVLAKKQPRKIFVQPNTIIDDKGEAVLKEYPVTIEGVIESFVERGI